MKTDISYHKKIAQDFMLVAFFVVVGKMAVGAKEITIAWRYGVSATVDAYVLMGYLINWPVSIWLSILTIVLVPTLTKLSARDAQSKDIFLAEVTGFTILLGVTFGAISWLFWPTIIEKSWITLPQEVQESAVQMVLPLIITVPLGFLVSFLSVNVMANGRHLNTLYEGVPSLVLIFFVLFFASIGLINSLVWGTVVGTLIQAVVLYVACKHSLSRWPILSMSSDAWHTLIRSIGILLAGQIMSTTTFMVDQWIASGLSVGSISTLGYANRILSLVMSIGAMAIGRATLPIFSIFHNAKDKNMTQLIIQWTKWMFLLGVVVALLTGLLAPIGVGFIFERGAFTPDNSRDVAQVLAWSAFQLPAYFAGLVLVSALGAASKYGFIALSGGVNLIVKLICTHWLTSQYQLAGLAFSNAIMYGVSFLILYMGLRTINLEAEPLDTKNG